MDVDYGGACGIGGDGVREDILNDMDFSMKADDISENRGMRAMKAASRIAAENGISDMTLKEINEEIARKGGDDYGKNI